MILRFALLSSLALSAIARGAPLIDPPGVTAGLGVNIHFTRPRPGEMERLAAGGFALVRMDFSWGWIEQQRGKYDFSEYETLLAALEPHAIRAIFILDYRNDLYDGGLSPHSDEGRAAFARWAVAGVQHFKNRNVIWEMYNEPNISQFWKPEKNFDDYIKLALEVGKAIKRPAPAETLVGPACSTMDFPFLEACFKGGVLEYFDAVSVHPYRPQPPETVAADYERLKKLIEQYAPPKKRIAIYSGEWGYSDIWKEMNPDKQGEYLARQWLINIASGVPVSIWYDWRDDGEDPNDAEHHFGTTTHDDKPKPAYLAAQKLTRELRGYDFQTRLPSGENDYLLLFMKNDAETIVAAWTTGESHNLQVAAMQIKLTQSPQYIKLPAPPLGDKPARPSAPSTPSTRSLSPR